MEFEKEIPIDKQESYYSPVDVESTFSSESVESESGFGKLTKGIVFETDDPTLPSLTFRVFLIGGLGGIILGLVNVILSFRTNAQIIQATVITLLGYPLGILLSWILPKGIFNPGPFSVKEHALLTILANAAGGVAYGIDNVAVQRLDTMIGDERINFWNSLAFVLTTQFIGFGLSGLCRRFLVRPASLIWPTALPTIATFVGFHQNNKSEEDLELDRKYPISRFSMFWLSFGFLFLYTFVPNYFATSFLAVSVFCFLSKDKWFKLMSSSSGDNGLGFGALTFDWGSFSVYAPMTTPWWASVNFYGALAVWTWVITPIMWKYDPFKTPYLKNEALTFGDGEPIYNFNTNHLFTNNGTAIAAEALYSKPNYDLNQTLYDQVAPLYISPIFVLNYVASFMALTAGISHCIVWYGKDIVRQARDAWNRENSEKDIHNQLMRAYPELPDWVYASFLGVMLVVQIMVGQFTPFHLPWYASLLGITIPLIFVIPFGIIQAISGFQLGLNVITEFVIGLIMPGRTIPVMIFKSYSYNVFIQALTLSQDLKTSHYMHINPIHVVICQLVGTFIGAVSNTAGAFWVMEGSNLLGKEGWNYTGYKTFLNAGAIWGAVGPWRFFGPDSPYFSLMLAFPIGLVLPVIPWLLNKAYPSKYWHLINFPIMTYFDSAGKYQTLIVIPFLIAFFSQFYMYRYKYDFFSKYNYIVSAGFDAGSGIALIFIFIFVTSTNLIPPFFEHPLNPSTIPDYYCFDNLGWSAPK